MLQTYRCTDSVMLCQKPYKIEEGAIQYYTRPITWELDAADWQEN